MTPATPSASNTAALPPLRIAIVGAESSGKTTLAADLARALARPPPGAPARPVLPQAQARPARQAGTADIAPARVALVPEVLREWCAARGRTPGPAEQHGILVEQHRRIEAAAAAHDIVVCDTTALMTHVYSDLLFADASLLDAAVQRHRTMAATLLTALDLPWVADGHQRDGEHVRRPVDDRLRELLLRHGFPFSVIAGQGEARLARALAALQPLLAAWQAESPTWRPGAVAAGGPAGPGPADGDAAAGARAAIAHGDSAMPARGRGLFSRLQDDERAPSGGAPDLAGTRRAREWVCDCCVPQAEQALLRARATLGPPGPEGPR